MMIKNKIKYLRKNLKRILNEFWIKSFIYILISLRSLFILISSSFFSFFLINFMNIIILIQYNSLMINDMIILILMNSFPLFLRHNMTKNHCIEHIISLHNLQDSCQQNNDLITSWNILLNSFISLSSNFKTSLKCFNFVFWIFINEYFSNHYDYLESSESEFNSTFIFKLLR